MSSSNSARQATVHVNNPSSTEDCKKEPGEVHFDLSLLCWGFWFTSTIVYGGNVYDVKPFLDDQKRGCTWEALWEFLCDGGRNMNKAAKDYQYSKSTQAIQQALFQFGGQQVVNCMSMNLLTPSLRTVKRNRSTFVPFLPGLQDSNFGEVAKILTTAKALHGITSDVAVIVAEDKTRVKSTMRWEARRDTLIGFCGDKDNHVCNMDLEVEVGFGESGYSKIVESFEQKIQGSYARVVIVNPLHEKLPRFIVYASVTCNSFTVSWVRDHWKGLKQRWDKCCREAVGPVLGHANDGDARRRKLMLEDYLGSEGQRWTVGWDGWVLSGIVLDSRDVYALGD
ncbi:hypothetical protein R1flu_022541 [Riccia fluitans]|uniref:Uncharacterized protein n=1 Tax=Riccia fluitans TaxID=41844 RepID=A0ABD1XPI8_9MARC